MDLKEKTVLITGANRGIGRALVMEALRRGVTRVFAVARGPQPAVDPRVTWLEFDIINEAQIAKALSGIRLLDVLINNAAIGQLDDLAARDSRRGLG